MFFVFFVEIRSAQAEGRSGYDAVMSYSLFYQASSGWSKWASCANVSNDLNRPDLVAFDGVAQIFAHFSHVALQSGYTDVVSLPLLSIATVPSGVPGALGASPLPKPNAKNSIG